MQAAGENSGKGQERESSKMMDETEERGPEEVRPDIARDEEDVRNSRIAVILLCVGVVCAIFAVIIAGCIINDAVGRIDWKAADLGTWGMEGGPDTEDGFDTEDEPDTEYDLDIDLGDHNFDFDVDVDKILSDFDAEAFQEALSRDIAKMEAEGNSKAASDGEGTALLDFCDNDELDGFAEDLEDREVTLSIYKDGKWYDTSDKEDILKAFDAMKTVRVGGLDDEAEDSDWMQIDFFDYQTETSWDFDFWGGCLDWRSGQEDHLYRVTDWGDLEGLSLDSMGLTLEEL